MLVYRDKSTTCETSAWLASLRQRSLSNGSVQELRDRLVDFGEFETAVIDACHPRLDEVDRLVLHLRRTSLALARSFVHSLRNEPIAATREEAEGLRLIDALQSFALPPRVLVKAAEGYAFWALYPEQYVNASRRLLSRLSTRQVVVLGLRNIGGNLASVMEACLALAGVDVYSRTLRPRGHPFSRRIEMGRELARELTTTRHRLHLVVDEGPGMSGSSFASAAAALESLGIAPSSVWFVPSHDADSNQFVNAEAVQAWNRHVRVTGETIPLTRFLPCHGNYVDISAGRWRSTLLQSKIARVPIQPQHERAKCLELDSKGRPTRIHRFCGLGSHGKVILERARHTQDAGYGPKVQGLRDGLLQLEFVNGVSMQARPSSRRLIHVMADYVTFRRQELRSTFEADPRILLEMAELNVRESLGDEPLRRVSTLFARASSTPLLTIYTDSRMFPHEWLRTESSYVKLDGFDHGDDHFYPGPCDPAWDLAGAIVEFGLSAELTAMLLARYSRRSGDIAVAQRMSFFLVAYLAFRVGYCAFAQRALGDSPDGQAFAAQAHRYRDELHARLRA